MHLLPAALYAKCQQKLAAYPSEEAGAKDHEKSAWCRANGEQQEHLAKRFASVRRSDFTGIFFEGARWQCRGKGRCVPYRVTEEKRTDPHCRHCRGKGECECNKPTDLSH